MATETISQDLADLLATRNFDPKYKDKTGKDCPAADAITFAFDWTAQSGKNYGTAVAVIGDKNDLMFFFGDNLGKSIEDPSDKNEWFQFLETMSNFATQHRYTWSPKDINQLKHTLAGIAAIKEGLFEGYYGTRRVSYMGEQTSARLVIKHNRMLGENDKRYRYVESLYIETADGERFKLPFTKLTGGRAMLEHVRQGGKPYDIRGNHIAEMVTEMNVLSRFNRASQNRVFEGSTAALVETAQSYYTSLQESLKHLSSSRGYKQYFESWSPADVGSEDALVEDIKTLFVEQSIDARIESALPLLAKIQQGTAMKEVQVFENWINNMAEGTWALPDTPEQEAKLQELMSQELIAGPDGTNATEQLYDLVGDDHLFDLISAAADADPNSNIWDNAEIVERLGELGVDTSAITQQSAEQPPQQPVAQDPMAPQPGAQAPAVAEDAAMTRRGFLRGLGAAAAGAAALGAAGNAQARATPEWMEMVEKAKLMLSKGMTPEQVAKILGVSGPNNNMAGPMGGEWGAINYAARELNRQRNDLKEGMADVDYVLQQLIDGDVDPYQIMNHPQGPEEEYIANLLKDEYEDVAINHRLHPDDDFEQILDRAVDNLAKKYGRPLDEADTVHSFGECGTVAGGMAPVQSRLEEDPEGDTVKNSLHTIVRVATHLEKQIDSEEDFPEWVSEKVGAIENQMVDVMNYEISDKEMSGEIDEGWFKNALAAGALAGAAMTGAGQAQAADLSQFSTPYLQQVIQGTHPRPMVDAEDAREELLARKAGKTQTTSGTQSQAGKGYSPEYLQSVIDGTHPRPMLSVEKAQQLLQQQGGVKEGQWGQAKQDPMNYNAAITGSYYESEDPLARIKTLALPK